MSYRDYYGSEMRMIDQEVSQEAENGEEHLDSRDAVTAQLLTDCAQILDVVKDEWGDAWSEWDQSVRDRLTKHLRTFYSAKSA